MSNTASFLYELTKLAAILSTFMFNMTMIIAIYLLADLNDKYCITINNNEKSDEYKK